MRYEYGKTKILRKQIYNKKNMTEQTSNNIKNTKYIKMKNRTS